MQYNFSNTKNDFKKIEEFLSKEYRELNIGRASPLVLDGILVDSYGSKMPIKNVASIAIEDVKTLRIIPWDKGQVKEIEKAIMTSNIGLSTATDEAGIRVIFPELNSENRQKMVKLLKEKLEDSRIAVRKERERVLDDIQAKEKEGKMTEDERFRGKEDLQKIVDETNKNLEEIFKRKEKEVIG